MVVKRDPKGRQQFIADLNMTRLDHAKAGQRLVEQILQEDENDR